MKGRILYIAYQAPPHGGARGLRIANIIKYLSEFGWKLDVLTINPSPSFAFYDAELIAKIPPSVNVFRTLSGILRRFYRDIIRDAKDVSQEPGKVRALGIQKRTSAQLARGLIKIANLVIPDIIAEWYPFALFQGIKLVRRNNYDLIISSAWPYTSHLVGYTIKKMSGLPWITEYGDPWAFNVVEGKSKVRFWLEHKMESRVLKSATAVVVTTDETKDNYLENYPFLSEDRVYVMSAGVEYNDFENLVPQKSEKFRLLFTGRMYQIADINPLFNALTSMANESEEIKNNLEVLFVGDISNKYRELIEAYNLKDMVFLQDFVPLKEALSLTIGADILLFLGNKGGLQVPSRLFYYLAAEKPILFIKGDEKDPALRFLSSLNRGFIVGNETEEIQSAIIRLYDLYQANRLEEFFDLSPIPDISWQNRVKILDKACESTMELNKV